MPGWAWLLVAAVALVATDAWIIIRMRAAAKGRICHFCPSEENVETYVILGNHYQCCDKCLSCLARLRAEILTARAGIYLKSVT